MLQCILIEKAVSDSNTEPASAVNVAKVHVYSCMHVIMLLNSS